MGLLRQGRSKGGGVRHGAHLGDGFSDAAPPPTQGTDAEETGEGRPRGKRPPRQGRPVPTTTTTIATAGAVVPMKRAAGADLDL
jgi:hypothetical protein